MKSRMIQLSFGLAATAGAKLAIAHGDHPLASGVSHNLLHAFGGWDNLLAVFAIGLVAAFGWHRLRRRHKTAGIINPSSPRS